MHHMEIHTALCRLSEKFKQYLCQAGLLDADLGPLKCTICLPVSHSQHVIAAKMAHLLLDEVVQLAGMLLPQRGQISSSLGGSLTEGLPLLLPGTFQCCGSSRLCLPCLLCMPGFGCLQGSGGLCLHLPETLPVVILSSSLVLLGCLSVLSELSLCRSQTGPELPDDCSMLLLCLPSRFFCRCQRSCLLLLDGSRGLKVCPGSAQLPLQASQCLSVLLPCSRQRGCQLPMLATAFSGNSRCRSGGVSRLSNCISH